MQPQPAHAAVRVDAQPHVRERPARAELLRRVEVPRVGPELGRRQELLPARVRELGERGGRRQAAGERGAVGIVALEVRGVDLDLLDPSRPPPASGSPSRGRDPGAASSPNPRPCSSRGPAGSGAPSSRSACRSPRARRRRSRSPRGRRRAERSRARSTSTSPRTRSRATPPSGKMLRRTWVKGPALFTAKRLLEPGARGEGGSTSVQLARSSRARVGCPGRSQASSEARSGWLPTKKLVSTSTERIRPRRPSASTHQSCPGVRRRRVSQPSIHLPRLVYLPATKTAGSGLTRQFRGAKNSSLA